MNKIAPKSTKSIHVAISIATIGTFISSTVYAAGYTSNELGNNTLIGNNTSQTIATGTATSAGNPDVSNWAMKLATITSPAPTYPITIAGSTADSEKQSGDPDFSDYVSVPSSYSRVAYRNNATDLGNSAVGSNFSTTYAAYISKTITCDFEAF